MAPASIDFEGAFEEGPETLEIVVGAEKRSEASAPEQAVRSSERGTRMLERANHATLDFPHESKVVLIC